MTRKAGIGHSVCALAALLAVLWTEAPSHAADIPAGQAFDIPAQPLTDALLAYSEQARVQIILAVDTSQMPPCRPLRGIMSAEDAIAHLLVESGLEYYFSSANTVTVRRVQPTAVRRDSADQLKSPPQPAN
jgi:hypothetical protein